MMLYRQHWATALLLYPDYHSNVHTQHRRRSRFEEVRRQHLDETTALQTS
jgi:hypothetical protein